MTTLASERRPTAAVVPRPAPRPAATAAQPIVTWAEQAPCTCPEACERDHEQD